MKAKKHISQLSSKACWCKPDEMHEYIIHKIAEGETMLEPIISVDKKIKHLQKNNKFNELI